MSRTLADTRAAKNWAVLFSVRYDFCLPYSSEVDGAYYRDGSPRRSLQDYLVDETANYELGANGSLNLKLVSALTAGKQRPHDQPAIQLLIGRRNASSRYHRLFLRVVLSQTGKPRQAILLGARSNAELDDIANGVPRKLVLGSTIGSIASHPMQVTRLRDNSGQLPPFRSTLPTLQHGDRITRN
jgi:hypothetical protein